MTTDGTTDPYDDPIYKTPFSADELKDADAIASLVKLPADDQLRGSLCRAIRHFVANVRDVAGIGWRTRHDEVRIAVLTRIATSPAEAAVVVAETAKKEILSLSSLAAARDSVTESFLCEIGFSAPDVRNLSPEDAAVVICRAYTELCAEARSALEQIGPRRGRSSDRVLDFFIFTIVTLITTRTQPKPAALIEALATALLMATNRARTRLDDLDEKARAIAVRKLDSYRALGDDALRKRIDALLADAALCQEVEAGCKSAC